MNDAVNAWGIVRKLSWEDALLVLGVLALAWVVGAILRWVIRRLALGGGLHPEQLILERHLGIRHIPALGRLLIIRHRKRRSLSCD